MKRLLLFLLGVLLLAGCGEPDMGHFKPGVVNRCRGYPGFLSRTGLGNRVGMDTRQRGYTGLRVLQQGSHRSWQHPSWDDAGHVGGMDRDKQGNMYLVTAPEVSLLDNPPKLQNRIYQVNHRSAEMQLWLELPGKPSLANPFGTMGIFYDCDTNSLYVSSVAESSPREVKGVIYQIDVATRQIVDQLKGVDAIGVGVFNGVQHKRLYFGSARSADVYSVALDVAGHFTTAVRREFSLAELPDGDTTRVRKFEFFPPQGQGASYIMRLKELEFGFRLPAENNLRKRMYLFRFEAVTDRWAFIETVPEG
ncbi:MAG: hypothetical protein CSA79_01400 [Thiothrix nivea]|nr:MAG: hypothetical protein CSA79_01400 [Thiothrix nivea]